MRLSLSSSGCSSTSNPNKNSICWLSVFMFFTFRKRMRRWEDESKLHSRVVSPATQMNWKCKWAAGDVFMRCCPPLVTCLLLFSRLSLWTGCDLDVLYIWSNDKYLFFFFFSTFLMKIFGGHKCSGDVGELPSLKWYLIFYTCVFSFAEKETF